MTSLSAVLDACVLYPAPLRDLLVQLADDNLFRAKWSDRIHEEWIRNVLKNRSDLTRDKLENIRRRMDESVLDCLVEGFEPLIDQLTLPDVDDRHVLVAAVTAKVDYIITFNLKHFPTGFLNPYGIQACHPDDFVMGLLGARPNTVKAAIDQVRARLRKPPVTPEEYLVTLRQQGLPKIANALQTFR